MTVLPKGSLSAPNSVLKELDVVCASIHSSFKLSEKEQTKRIVKAVENPYVNTIGHPTGRKINGKPGIKVDLEMVFRAAKKNRVALEINAMPNRLDLNDVNARAAQEAGVMLAIGSDSHSTEHMPFLGLGTAVARRAWCEKKHILNAWPLKRIEKFLHC